MRKKVSIKFIKNFITLFLTTILLIYILYPNNVLSVSTKSTIELLDTETEKIYDELKKLVETVEKNQDLANAVYKNFESLDLETKPTKEIYGEEYTEAVTKWLAVSLVPDMEQTEELKKSLLNTEPFSKENLSIDEITSQQYQYTFDIINNSLDTYNQIINLGGSINDAVQDVNKYLNTELTNYVESEIKSLVQEVENIPELSNMIYNILENLNYGMKPQKSDYGESYLDAIAKWLTVGLIPDIDKTEEIKNALKNPIPFLEDNLSNLGIDLNQYKNTYNVLKNTFNKFNDSEKIGQTINEALDNAKEQLNSELVNVAETGLKPLIDEIESIPSLSDIFYNKLGDLGLGIKPSKETYGVEYKDAIMKWITVSLIPESAQSEEIKNALKSPKPFLEECLSNLNINSEQYQTAYDLLKSTLNTFDTARNDGSTIEKALNIVGEKLNIEIPANIQKNLAAITGVLVGSDSADTSDFSSVGEINTDMFKPEVTNNRTANSIIGKIFGGLQVIGIIAIILSIGLVGFNTIVGSVEEKAQGKGKAIGILFGAIMITAVSTIAKLIISAIE